MKNEKFISMKNLLKTLSTSRKACQIEIVISSVIIFLVGVVNYDEYSVLACTAAVLITPFFFFLFHSFWKTIDDGLAPEKFSPRNLIIRDIIIRYLSVLLLFIGLSILFLVFFEKTNAVVFVILAIISIVLLIAASVYYFKENLKLLK
ncbi:MAG: hypothetical protein LBN40_03995 [Oscillospiraceae bacterium]|jgi:hypothetical protein|nr:hypothetical protein [Oscillospiraceae bacterium]